MTRKRSPATVGARLKRARERCGLSMRQIADSTKISVTVLEGIERDDITYLPGGVLGRGYVRSFAEAVKLDSEITVAEFVAQFPESSVKDGYPPSERIEEDKVAEVRTSRGLMKIRLHASGTGLRVASVAVAAVVLAGVVAVAAPKRWPSWSALQSLADAMPGKRLASLRSRLIPMLRPSTAPTLTSASALPVTTRAQVRAKPSVTEAEASRTSGTSLETPTRFDKPLKITLSANSQSWVIATVDGKVVINRFFEMGEEGTLEAKREFAVTAGNGGSIVMTLNGKGARALGRTGKTVTVRVNRDNLEQYLKRGR